MTTHQKTQLLTAFRMTNQELRIYMVTMVEELVWKTKAPLRLVVINPS